ncbi:uncharacterized protein LOC123544914 [Mercenaria mercenaria]|uniref:uncharacterized protein LOC123544914 n=1 Tax=Mercenaria mercenaria TaxID=6596 RepID=UPI00234EF373|nr:uncharacterized protein LOC123544914 [Mercenaria mercenaria]
MVRVISQGFNTPRSRHSSGEDMIDRFAAMKALGALHDDESSKQSLKTECVTTSLVIDCSTDTNDSFSGVDSEEDSRACNRARDIQNNNTLHQDPVTLKKERRRERNKLSAQNYRQRRRQQSTAAQKTLESLESHHKILLEKVRHLEAEKHIVEEYLKNCVRVPWCPFHQPASPPNPNNCNNIQTGPKPANPPTQPDIMNPTQICSSIPGPSSSSASFSPLPDNFRHHPEEFTPIPEGFRPLNMVVEENNNMPLCMPGVARPTEESSIS